LALNPQKILIVKTSSLGDVIHNFPMVTDIKQQHPDCKIDWLVEEAYAPLIKMHPAFTESFLLPSADGVEILASKEFGRRYHSFPDHSDEMPTTLCLTHRDSSKAPYCRKYHEEELSGSHQDPPESG